MEEAGGGVGDRIKQLRTRKKLGIRKLAGLTGVSDSFISLLEKNKRKGVSYEVALKLAKALNTTPEYILGHEPELPGVHKPLADVLEDVQRRLKMLELAEVPVLGYVPGGEPLTPEDSPTEFALIPKELVKGMKRIFALRLRGDSLAGFGVHDGDILVIDRDAQVIDGKVYILQIGNEVTAKKLCREDDRLKLVGSNGSFEIMEPRRVENLGRVILHGNWKKL